MNTALNHVTEFIIAAAILAGMAMSVVLLGPTFARFMTFLSSSEEAFKVMLVVGAASVFGMIIILKLALFG